jgi:hypothetical protein
MGMPLQRLPHLPRRPEIHAPLAARVVQRRQPRSEHRCVFEGHLAQHEGQGLAPDVGPLRAIELAPRAQVHPRQLGLVVQHHLEVRPAPVRCLRVAEEPSADHVPQPRARHVLQGYFQKLVGPLRRPPLLPCLQQRGQCRGTRKLGLVTEPAPEEVGVALHGRPQDLWQARCPCFRQRLFAFAQAGGEFQPPLPGQRRQCVAVLTEPGRDPVKEAGEVIARRVDDTGQRVTGGRITTFSGQPALPRVARRNSRRY